MSLFKWSGQFNVGVEAIDDDHRRLVRTINDLYNAVQRGQEKEVQGEVLLDLVLHTTNHFALEEELMQKCQYPAYQDHMAEHALFAQRVHELRKEFESGNSSLSIETLNSLANWFHHHVTGTDMKLTPFLLRNVVEQAGGAVCPLTVRGGTDARETCCR